MIQRSLVAAAAVVVLAAGATAQPRVLVLSSGSPQLDLKVVQALIAQGLQPVGGPEPSGFDQNWPLHNIDVVYFQENYNWQGGGTWAKRASWPCSSLSMTGAVS